MESYPPEGHLAAVQEWQAPEQGLLMYQRCVLHFTMPRSLSRLRRSSFNNTHRYLPGYLGKEASLGAHEVRGSKWSFRPMCLVQREIICIPLEGQSHNHHHVPFTATWRIWLADENGSDMVTDPTVPSIVQRIRAVPSS